MPKARPAAKRKKPAGPPRITATMFYKHLRCPHWVYWDLYGDADDKAEVSALTEKIWEHGVVHEHEVIGQYGDFDEVPEYGDEEELFTRTVELMKKGSGIIYHGRLIDGSWVGVPDLLFKTTLPLGRSSKLGRYIYEPYDIKSAHIERPEDVKDEYRFQLAFYALILEKIQGVRPEYGHIIDAERRTVDVRVNEVLDDFHLTLREIEKIIAGEKPAPFLASACKESPWFSLCKKEAQACDDVCLIYKIRRSDHAKLYAAGIKTVTELAATDLDTLEQAVPDMSRRKLEAIRRQALALHENRAIVISQPVFRPASVEVYFDIEGDPLRGVEYLFGVLVVKGERSKGKYEYFLAKTPDEEEKAWHEFLAFIRSLPEDAAIYHYGTYERSVVNRLKNMYGGDEKAVAKLEARLENLLTTACETVALPVYFYSLKDIAKWLKFNWRHAQAGGANSITWYEEYLQLKDQKGKAAKARKILQDIIDYNEDDVRATLHLKRWLSKLPEPV